MQRKERITVHATESEHAAIKAAADRCGLSMGAFLRQLALAEINKTKTQPEK